MQRVVNRGYIIIIIREEGIPLEREGADRAMQIICFVDNYCKQY